ncbi:MAG TPA: FkbM family methyltransferase, partial [Tepidisphaeraceae bacterium]|nr:FkbM family methyltransferase [Tepidisphaeraceae bacterium]
TRAAQSGGAPVRVLCAAVSAPGARLATFKIASRSRSANALAGFGLTTAGGAIEEGVVPLFTLDDLLAENAAPPPGVLKVDVEGAEVALLSGAVRMLGDVRPIIHIEVDPANAEAVGAVLTGHGYRLFDADAPDRETGARAAWNCLAMPG